MANTLKNILLGTFSKVTPCGSSCDSIHGNTLQTKRSCNLNRFQTFGFQGVNRQSLLPGQGKASLSVAVFAAILSVHIIDIILFATDPKVLWVNASGIITAMQNTKPIRNAAIVHLEGKTVASVAPAISVDATIAKTVRLAFPNPTTFGFHNVFPESFENVSFSRRGTTRRAKSPLIARKQPLNSLSTFGAFELFFHGSNLIQT